MEATRYKLNLLEEMGPRLDPEGWAPWWEGKAKFQKYEGMSHSVSCPGLEAFIV